MGLITTFACDVITLKEGHIPYAGIFSNLIFPKSVTYARINETFWNSQFQPYETKEVIDYIAARVHVLSATEKAMNLFAFSLGFRCFTILCSSLKLTVDKSSFRPLVKNALSIAISVLPGLALYYFMDYSMRDYILGAIFTQGMAAFSSVISNKWGNYFRRLDLISNDSKFSSMSYLVKFATSFISDIAITLMVHGMMAFRNPSINMGAENVIRYCVEMDKAKLISVANQISVWTHQSRTMISIDEKLTFFAGKSLVDLMFVVANYFGKQEDLRSPFINAFKKSSAEIKQEESMKLQRATEEKRLSKKNKKQQNKQKGHKDTAEVADIKPVSATAESAVSTTHTVQAITERKPKDKKKVDEKALKKSEVITSSSESSISEVRIADKIFYPIHSDKLPPNTWAVLSLRKSFEDTKDFENCLKRNAMESTSSRVVYDRVKRMYKIKPATTGDRVLGAIHQGSIGFDRLFDLANSISAYERLRGEGNGIEPNLIVFDQRKKHDNVYRT